LTKPVIVNNFPPPPPSTVERDFILKNIKISVPERERKKYLELL
jgi:hypothetical protein